MLALWTMPSQPATTSHQPVQAPALLRCLQAVPANLTRYGLSQIINHLLALGERAAAAELCCSARTPQLTGRCRLAAAIARMV